MMYTDESSKQAYKILEETSHGSVHVFIGLQL